MEREQQIRRDEAGEERHDPLAPVRVPDALHEDHEHGGEEQHHAGRDDDVRDERLSAGEMLVGPRGVALREERQVQTRLRRARQMHAGEDPEGDGRDLRRLHDRVGHHEQIQDRDGEDDREEDDLASLAAVEIRPDADAARVDVRDRHERDDRDRRHDHPRERRIHVQQQLLEVEEVPRRLRWIRRVIGIRHVLQRRVHQRADHEQPREEEHRRDELDHEQVRPGHRGVLDALVDAHHGVLLDERKQSETSLLTR
jgi:hypothetical protein